MYYDFSKTHDETITSPYIDSVSIEKPLIDSILDMSLRDVTEDMVEVIRTYYNVQPYPSGDYIDISFLAKGYYIFAIHIKDCVIRGLFRSREVYTEVNNDSVPPEIYPCEKYKHIKYSIAVHGSYVTYDVSNNGTITPPYVDSVWITTVDDFDKPIQTYYVQSRDSIDISFLNTGQYVLIAYIKECIMSRVFFVRRASTDLENTPLESVENGKFIYYQGVLYFKAPDGTCYDILGRRMSQNEFGMLEE